jgi:hypothetical protein
MQIEGSTSLIDLHSGGSGANLGAYLVKPEMAHN